MTEGAESVWRGPCCGFAGARKRDGRSGAVRAVLDQRDSLKEARLAGGVAGDGLEAGQAELVGDPVDGGFVTGLKAHAAFELVTGNVGEVAAQVGLLNARVAFGDVGGHRGLGAGCRAYGGERQQNPSLHGDYLTGWRGAEIREQRQGVGEQGLKSRTQLSC